MDTKKINIMWGISLFVISVATIITAVANILGAELPDTAVRMMGVLQLIALPVFAYSTVKKLKRDK